MNKNKIILQFSDLVKICDTDLQLIDKFYKIYYINIMTAVKRLLWILSFIILITDVCFATNMRPVWNDYCPEGLRDAQYKDVQWFWPEGTRESQEIYNYWAQRRNEFYDGLVKCDLMAEDFREVCYSNLRSKQAMDNELYIQKLENKKMSSQIWRDTTKISSPVMFKLLSR